MGSLVQIVGGPRDGEYVPYIGRELRLPIARRVRFVPDTPALPSPDGGRILYDSYDFHRWTDGYGSFEGRYVRRDIAPGLGCP